MKNKKRSISILLIVGICAVIIGFILLRPSKAYVDEVDQQKVKSAFTLLNDSLDIKALRYQEFIKEQTIDYQLNDSFTVPVQGETVILDYRAQAEYIITADKAGLYHLELDYMPTGTSLTDFNIQISINDSVAFEEMNTLILPLIWEDETKDFPVDGYGDEISLSPNRVDEWTTGPLYNTTYYTSEPLLFPLSEGENKIIFTNVSSDGLALGKLSAIAPKDNIPTYEQYLNGKNGDLIQEFIEINGIDYTQKNSNSAVLSSTNNPALYPHDSKNKKINTIAWKDAGTEVTYEIDVLKTGFYNFAFHYRNEKEDFQVFQTFKIDGEIPFKELRSYAFDTTDNKWGNEILSDESGNAYKIYLTEGTHTFTIRTEQEPVTYAWRNARLIAEHVTQFALEIKRITGAEVDKNRTWKITKYIPNTVPYLEAYETLIYDIQNQMQQYAPNGANSARLSDLDRALMVIEKLKEYPDEIALYIENLTGNSISANNSLLKLLGDFTSNITPQPFALDRVYVYGDNSKLPKENPNVFEVAANELTALVSSFTSEKYLAENDPEALNIWVNRAITQVDLLQKMVDTEFTPQTGIKVKISLIPDPNKLTLAAAANETPDVALGLSSNIPFDLASREALYDLSEFDDFWEVADRFAPGAFVPYLFNGGVYAVPETSDFNLTIYRKDIFNSIGIEVPDTWQDVVDILPELQRYGMNFYHTIATNIGYKWFYQTTPMIYQFNGQLYSEDGLTSVIDEPNSVKGIKFLGELFSIYSIPTQIPQFNDSFRYGILPIGVANLESYNLIKNGAPELEGQWGMSLLPGIVHEDGTINRSFVSAGTGGIVFKDTEKANEAWEFLKWWLAHDVQTEYAHTLQSTFGKENIWLPSNLAALADCTLPTEHKLLIVEQLEHLRDVPRTPGQYVLERSLSDIWNKIALDGTSAQVAIDEKIMEIQREMRKKMKDFGFSDAEGNLLKSYVIYDVDWIREQIENHKKGE